MPQFRIIVCKTTKKGNGPVWAAFSFLFPRRYFQFHLLVRASYKLVVPAASNWHRIFGYMAFVYKEKCILGVSIKRLRPSIMTTLLCSCYIWFLRYFV